MRINVSCLSFELTDAIVQHVEERVKLVLGMASDRIDHVSVHLADINGDRGGVDKRCRIIVGLRGLNAVVVGAVHRDLYTAIDSAVSRAKQAVRRQLDRRRTLTREHAQRAQRWALA